MFYQKKIIFSMHSEPNYFNIKYFSDKFYINRILTII